MNAAGKPAQHAAGLFRISRLAQDIIVKYDGSVGRQKRGVAVQGLDRLIGGRKLLGQPVHGTLSLFTGGAANITREHGRESCRERVCQYVWVTVSAVCFKK